MVGVSKIFIFRSSQRNVNIVNLKVAQLLYVYQMIFCPALRPCRTLALKSHLHFLQCKSRRVKFTWGSVYSFKTNMLQPKPCKPQILHDYEGKPVDRGLVVVHEILLPCDMASIAYFSGTAERNYEWGGLR